MKLEDEIENKILKGKEQSLLELIDKDRTNISSIKFLTHYELAKEKGNQLVHLRDDIQKFMLQLRADDPLIETRIDENGEFSNFLFRLKNSKILNSVNILSYVSADLPFELKGDLSDGTKIFTIKFFSAIKNEIDESQVDDLVENDEIVIMEDEKYLHIQIEDIKSIEKYWTENIFKAIYFLKKKGFYTGLNDPDKKANIELLKEFAQEEIIYMFSRENLKIDNLKNINMAQICVRNLPNNLNTLLKIKYKKFQNRVKKPVSLNTKFLNSSEEKIELKKDIIEEMVYPKKLPSYLR